MVEACLRDGAGGSPTAVLLDGNGFPDPELATLAPRTGASHVVVLSGDRTEGLRFFTAEGELPACGHGTVAAIAVLALRSPGARFEGRLQAGDREFDATGDVDRAEGLVEAWFDQGIVRRRAASGPEQEAFLAALGLERRDLDAGDEVVVASPGRERLLVPVADREVLAGLEPDQGRLAEVSREFGRLGCFVHGPETAAGRLPGRMFAPVAGVPEDVANANSAGCLAAHRLATGRNPVVVVDQGDALGRPSTVHASATWSGGATVTRVGGTARVSGPLAMAGYFTST